jgi:phage-related protein
MYRLFIEKTGHDYLRISLQYKKGSGWRLKEREYCDASNRERFGHVVTGYMRHYRIEAANVIDTRYDYKDVSYFSASINELKLWMEFCIWKRQLRRLKRHVEVLHTHSGQTQHTRRKYWIMTDWRGNPLLMTSYLKDQYKRKGYYSKQVDAMSLDRECIWNTDSLYS